jgi:hypothetical protein
MEKHTKPLDGGRGQPRVNDTSEVGRFHKTDSTSLASRQPRDSARFVHPEDYADRANVWGFVIVGEAFTTEEGIGIDQVVDEIDRVFAGEQNPSLPIITYEITEVNGEAYPRIPDQDGD